MDGRDNAQPSAIHQNIEDMNVKFEEEWVSANPKYAYMLEQFHDALDTQEITWEMLTIRNLNKIREWWENNNATNTAFTYCAILKAFLAQFVDTDILPCKRDFKNALKIKKNPSEHITLTESEIALIENYEPKTVTEIEVKARFLCEYYSLARSSDIDAMTDENIDEGKRLIRYTSKKTKQSAIVPLHKDFMKYFRQRGNEHNRSVYNRTIKRICQNCGIDQPIKLFYRGKETTCPKYELVGSHTARRSGATNLAKRGTPIPIIAKMMSHGQDIAMTQRYIWVDDIELPPDAAAFFG